MIQKERKTKETDIKVSLELYGTGQSSVSTGVGFLDHMLESFAKHALIDLRVECKGDTHIDDHHSVEDIAIVMGDAFAELLYPVQRIERFGNATVVMDEAAVSCDMDVSNRPYLHYEIGIEGFVGKFDTQLCEEFFRALIMQARLSMHLVMLRGKNNHHIIEAAFKAVAVALRRAVTKNERITVPSTKGVL